jgi:hypothetical protein
MVTILHKQTNGYEREGSLDTEKLITKECRVFPIPINQSLSFTEVSKFWSREIVPRATFKECFDTLVKAWLRGELTATGAKREHILQAIYRQPPDLVAFAVVGSAEPPQVKELPDGAKEVAWLWLVPIPNSEPETWNESNCVNAFAALALAWDSDRFALTVPVVSGLQLTQSTFSRWIESTGRKAPVFWMGDEELERAKMLARKYFDLTKRSRRTPKQSEFEKEVLGNGWRGRRDILRKACKIVARKRNMPVRAGRPRKDD